VAGVAVVAAVVSYENAYALVGAHGESGWTARLIPLTVDGLVYASSMVMLDSARRGVRVPVLARWLLGLGIAATLAANIAHGLGNGAVGAVVGAWPAVALVGSYELLMVIIRAGSGGCARGGVHAGTGGGSASGPGCSHSGGDCPVGRRDPGKASCGAAAGAVGARPSCRGSRAGGLSSPAWPSQAPTWMWLAHR
jgi:Protein of unknown function (DUF2637)